MEGQTLRPIIGKLIDKLKELESEPLSEQSIHRIRCQICDMDKKLSSIQFDLGKIEAYERQRQEYDAAIQKVKEWLKE